jgi:IS5 family transposase
MYSLADIWNGVQTRLFPFLEEWLDEPLTEKQKKLAAILEVVRIEERVTMCPGRWVGRPISNRKSLARAFVAKAVCNLPTTEALVEALRTEANLRKICGFAKASDVPSASTFSRSFREFAEGGLCDTVHEQLVVTYLGAGIVAHISRDSTAIEAREKPVAKAKPLPRAKRKPGRPKKGEHREPKEPTRLERQIEQSATEALAELPKECGVGAKKNSKGKQMYWDGYKAHIDTADHGLPVNVVTTSASLHDSQVAIPMSRITAQRVTSLYDVMDAAYDAKAIFDVSHSLNHRPIIDTKRSTTWREPLDPATKERFKVRTTAERVNSRLKDEFGARHVRVKGHAKVHAHIMFGILVLFADQLLKLAT